MSSSFSIVMTTFNSAETIESAIISVLGFEVPATEIIIVDDCSSDSTVAIIKRYSRIEKRIKLLSKSCNEGQSQSRNLGVQLSTTENVIFMDDDDFSLRIRPSIHLRFLEKGYDLSYLSTIKKYINGYEIEHVNSNYTFHGDNKDKLIRQLVLGEKERTSQDIYSPSCALAIKKSSFLEIGGFRVNMRRLEDIDFACRAIESNLRIAWSSQIGVIRLDTGGSDKTSIKNSEGELILLNNFQNYFSCKERFVFRIMSTLRRKYLAGKYVELFLSIPQVFVLIILQPKKLISVRNRFVHDLRKNLSG